MTKRRMRNTGLVSTVSLIIIAAVSIAATHRSVPGNSTLHDTCNQLWFDTTLLKLNGIPAIGELSVPAITLNKQAREFTEGYIKRNSELLEKMQQKSPRTFRLIDDIFTKYGLPLELKYLAVIESQLKSTALSHVGARGWWQLMPETARILSLKVNAGRDDRTHLYRSTVAAAKYLKDLYKLFGDWTLVIAAYNSGPGRVYEAIKKSGSRNFWKLQHHLPAETRGHVKKFISTHYYFEGKAGITTMTKEETIAYKKQMIAFVDEHNTLLMEKYNEEQDSSDTTDLRHVAMLIRITGQGKNNNK
ncbi:MAG: lytic transglycosylase domain-containing protein [Chitinophagaceae bacterium]|nr:lytic transglycosylase domain-containing protein [Chitinophagaceae bacterium]